MKNVKLGGRYDGEALGGEFKREQGEMDMMRTHCTCVLHFQRVLKNNGELSCKIRNMDLDPDKIV